MDIKDLRSIPTKDLISELTARKNDEVPGIICKLNESIELLNMMGFKVEHFQECIELKPKFRFIQDKNGNLTKIIYEDKEL